MGADELAIGIDSVSEFLAILIHHRIVDFFAVLRLPCDPNNLLVSGFLLNRVLSRGWQILHLHRSFLLRLRGQSENETSANGCHSNESYYIHNYTAFLINYPKVRFGGGRQFACREPNSAIFASCARERYIVMRFGKRLAQRSARSVITTHAVDATSGRRGCGT